MVKTMRDLINSLAIGVCGAIIATLIAISVYDAFLDQTVTIETKYWDCTLYKNRDCVQWSRK